MSGDLDPLDISGAKSSSMALVWTRRLNGVRVQTAPQCPLPLGPLRKVRRLHMGLFLDPSSPQE
eukprot:4641924-Pyramimonas_sp.AAC.1